MRFTLVADGPAEAVQLRKVTEAIAKALGETGAVGPFWLDAERLARAVKLIGHGVCWVEEYGDA